MRHGRVLLGRLTWRYTTPCSSGRRLACTTATWTDYKRSRPQILLPTPGWPSELCCKDMSLPRILLSCPCNKTLLRNPRLSRGRQRRTMVHAGCSPTLMSPLTKSLSARQALQLREVTAGRDIANAVRDLGARAAAQPCGRCVPGLSAQPRVASHAGAAVRERPKAPGARGRHRARHLARCVRQTARPVPRQRGALA